MSLLIQRNNFIVHTDKHPFRYKLVRLARSVRSDAKLGKLVLLSMF